MRRLLTILVSERLVMVIIVVNAAVVTAGGFYPEGSAQKHLLDLIDVFCVAFFVFEVLAKVGLKSWSRYWGRGWNRFDFIIIVLCLPVLLTPFSSGELDVAWLTVLRLGRLFRLFRLLRFIPDIHGLIAGTRRALRASVGVFLGLFLVNLIFAVAATFIFQDTAPEQFGNPARSFYSIFRIFTIEGWHEYPDALEADAVNSQWRLGIRIFFMITVMTGGMLGFSLANAVFIDEMTMDNNRQLERKVDALTTEIHTLRHELRRLASPPTGPAQTSTVGKEAARRQTSST